MWRENLEISWPATKSWSFSEPPTYSKSKYTWKAILVPSALHWGSVSLEFDNSPLKMIETTWEQVDITALGPDSYLWLKNTVQNSYFDSYPLCWRIGLQAGNKIELQTQRGAHLETQIGSKTALTWFLWYANELWHRKWPIVSKQLTIWPLKSIKVNKSSF